MGLLRRLRDRIRGTLGHDRVSGEIAEELQFHEDKLAERLASDGWSAAAARAEAKRRLGNRLSLQDRGYDVRGGGALEAFVQDVRYAARRLKSAPGFAAIAILTLALGIGANTAIVSVARGVLFRPLPYASSDRLVMVWMDNARINLAEDWHSFPDFVDYRDRSTTFDGMAAFNRRPLTLTGDGDPERVAGVHATAGLWSVLGTPAALGRTFSAEEDDGAARVVVLSHRFWQRRFGGDTGVVGRSIELNGQPTRIVGVMPDGFAFPTTDVDLWVPTSPTERLRTARGSLWLQIVGRMKPDVAVPRAQADLERVSAALLQEFPQRQGYGVNVVDYREQIVGRIRPTILALAGAVGFVLLIACANIANLLLARVSLRRREVALRAALGAGRGRIVRQLLTESLLLGVLGGLAGTGLGWLGVRALVGAAPPALPRLDAIAVDARVLAITTALAILTSIVFGLAPALQTARTDPGDALKDGGRSATGPGRRLRRALVAGEVALAVVLLVGAGLMLRSLVAMQRVDLGMDTAGVLRARVALSGDRYREDPVVVAFFQDLVARAAAMPGVQGAAAVGTVFLSDTPNSTNFSIEGRPDFPPEQRIEVPLDAITPDYFRVMRVPLLEGRFFDARDSGDAAPVVIINETMARRFWPGESPLGRRMKYGQLDSRAPWLTIVGVVADTRRTGYEASVRPETYLPHAMMTDNAMTVVLRTADAPMSKASALQDIVRSLDPKVPLQAVRPLDDEVREMTAGRRLNTTLFGLFGVIAAMLAAVGVYGVMAGSVASRTREMGLRFALGASRTSILRTVLTEALTLAALGIGAGLAAALALSGALTSLLYQVSPTDPATLAAIAALTLVVALGASLVPALRALRVDPVEALRAE